MANTPLRQTHIPLPSVSGENQTDPEANATLVPIHIVTHASQLPNEFVDPSPEKHLVVGFDCEGVDLCRHGNLCVMQIAFPDAVYLVDAVQGGEELVKVCKPALESKYVTKVIHDCKRDSEALYFQFGIKLNNVIDTQIAYSLIEEQEGRTKLPDNYISFVSLLADSRYCGVSYQEKEEVRLLLRQNIEKGKAYKVALYVRSLGKIDVSIALTDSSGQKKLATTSIISSDVSNWTKMEVLLNATETNHNSRLQLTTSKKGVIWFDQVSAMPVETYKDPQFWTYRPLSELMVRAAADDVRFLLYIYHKMMEKLSQQSLWHLAVRGALYCRCFCISDNEYADWPPLPSVSDNFVEGNAPEEEILSVLDVPYGMMGRVIGRRGASILSIKESCNAEILIGGAKGPPDKVFIIGSVRQVRKAEAMLRGRMLEI